MAVLKNDYFNIVHHSEYKTAVYNKCCCKVKQYLTLQIQKNAAFVSLIELEISYLTSFSCQRAFYIFSSH